MNDRTIIRACRVGVSSTPNPIRKRPLCEKCQTTHYRRGRIEAKCAGKPSYFTPEEINAFVAEAREKRIAASVAAYEARKTS